MRFFTFAAAAAAALFTTAFALDTEVQVGTTDKANPLYAPGPEGSKDVKAGEPYTIEWFGPCPSFDLSPPLTETLPQEPHRWLRRHSRPPQGLSRFFGVDSDHRREPPEPGCFPMDSPERAGWRRRLCHPDLV